MNSNDDGADVVDGQAVSHWRRPFGRRNVIAGIAGFGITAGFGGRKALAQESTPAADDTGTDDQAEDDQFPSGQMAEEIAAAYENFVSKLTTNLGETDTATVDTAIRDALKAMVDEQFDAGNISEKRATALKDKIDSSPAPLAVARRGGPRNHRMKKRRNRRHDRRDSSDDSSQDDSNTPEGASTPTFWASWL